MYSTHSNTRTHILGDGDDGLCRDGSVVLKEFNSCFQQSRWIQTECGHVDVGGIAGSENNMGKIDFADKVWFRPKYATWFLQVGRCEETFG